tara:strand:- start:2693 stop:3166 length:474 start_codon:yes stop_codon:yes gene_type:complete
MNNLDFKSVVIGGLMVCCFLLFTGQKKANETNFGDIQVSSITIKSNGSVNGGTVQIYNDRGERIGYLGVDKEEGGSLMLSDKYGDLSVMLTDNDGGLVQTYNKGENWALMGSDANGGYLNIRQGLDNVFFGTMVYESKPMIGFWDKNNNFVWGKGLD